MSISQQQREEFQRNGFLHLRSFFSPDDVERFKRATTTTVLKPGEKEVRFMHRVPGMEEWWADTRMLETARQLLGAPVIYFFDAHTLRYNFAPGEPIQGRHLHHDAKGT